MGLEKLLKILSISIFLSNPVNAELSDNWAFDNRGNLRSDFFEILSYNQVSYEGIPVNVTYIKSRYSVNFAAFSNGNELFADTFVLEQRARELYRHNSLFSEFGRRLSNLSIDVLTEEYSEAVGMAIYSTVYKEKILSMSEDDFVKYFIGSQTTGQLGNLLKSQWTRVVFKESGFRGELRAFLKPFRTTFVDPRICIADALINQSRNDDLGNAARTIVELYSDRILNRVSAFLSLSPQEARRLNLEIYNYLFNSSETILAEIEKKYLPSTRNEISLATSFISNSENEIDIFANESRIDIRNVKSDNSILQSSNLIIMLERRARVLGYDPDNVIRAVQRASAEFGVPEKLIYSVMFVESNFNPVAVSHAGAQGLMQLMPETARNLVVYDPFDIEDNIRGGTMYLRQMLDRFNNVALALAAYNAGPEAVERYRNIPPYRETKKYVPRVLGLYH